MATAELAVVLPSVVLVLAVAWSALAAATDQVRCLDSARATARLLARGDPAESALAAGRRLAPVGAVLTVSRTPAEIEVEVVAPPLPGLAWLGSGATPRGTSVAAREDLLDGGAIGAPDAHAAGQ
jgi:hypothetical protein